MNKSNQTYYQYGGIIHVHSTYSDGQKSVTEIMDIANELDIDFLLLSDHNTLQPKFDGLEGWYGNVLLGIGCELNDHLDRNHYLAFNINEEIDPELPPEEYVQRVRDLGGVGIIAHPNENRDNIAKYPPYPWTEWDTESFDGIEIWNQMSEWMEGLTHTNKFWRILHPRRSIIAPKKETLEIWDSLNRKRRVTGIGGVDAHGHRYRLMGLFTIQVFRYKVSFRTIRTHILSPDKMEGQNYQNDLQIIYNALRGANCFISHRLMGDASDFRFTAENEHGSAIIGQSLPFSEKTVLRVDNPLPAKTVLIGNGKVLNFKNGDIVEFDVDEPGVYRVETHIKNRPWILSNHIRLLRDI